VSVGAAERCTNGRREPLGEERGTRTQKCRGRRTEGKARKEKEDEKEHERWREEQEEGRKAWKEGGAGGRTRSLEGGGRSRRKNEKHVRRKEQEETGGENLDVIFDELSASSI